MFIPVVTPVLAAATQPPPLVTIAEPQKETLHKALHAASPFSGLAHASRKEAVGLHVATPTTEKASQHSVATSPPSQAAAMGSKTRSHPFASPAMAQDQMATVTKGVATQHTEASSPANLSSTPKHAKASSLAEADFSTAAARTQAEKKPDELGLCFRQYTRTHSKRTHHSHHCFRR